MATSVNITPRKAKSLSKFVNIFKIKSKPIIDNDTSTVLFKPKCQLTNKDFNFLKEMVTSSQMLCITDPSLPDNPIIYASPAFLECTEYDEKDIIGKNCRFLQGPATEKEDVNEIRNAIADETETVVYLVNYTKTGKMFQNQFFITPLQSKVFGVQRTQYFIGIQCAVSNGDRETIVNHGKLFRMKQDTASEESESHFMLMDENIVQKYEKRNKMTTTAGA